MRAFRDLGSFRDALHQGTVGVDQVNEIARLHANPRCQDQLADSEQILLDAARQLEYRDFTTVTHRWQTLADPDGAHRDHAVADARRDFAIHDHRLYDVVRLARAGDHVLTLTLAPGTEAYAFTFG